MPFLFVFIFILSLSISANPASAVTESVVRGPDVQAIISRADELHLSRDPYWRTLVHYKPVFGGGYESLVDDPKFFLAKDGKKNPEAELTATIEAFFTAKVDGVQHPTARFPARYAWLRNKLNLDTSVFPYDGDVDYLALKKIIDPGAFYLVFPTGYMKKPASMFGHTFLLVEAKNKNRLLSHALNYGAIADKSPGLLFVIKGLIGAYPGYYSYLPYYQKIQEYGDMDMRDMWEYKLDFTDEEGDRFLRHAIEMSNIYSDYYYISENCSYNIMFLIEAAKPETKATDQFGYIVEPIATVKLMDRLGLTDGVTYRPSLYSKIKYRMSLLSSKERAYVKAVCLGKKTTTDFSFTDMDAPKEAELWDLASDYLKFLLSSGKITSSDYRKRIIAVLSARKNLGKIDVASDPPIPAQPQKAHGSSRIDLTAGNDIQGGYAEIGYRLAAHEIMDIDPGYTRNSQLVFGKVSARWRFDSKTLSLREADLVDIVSLPASDSYFFSPCYEFKTGLAMNQGNDEREYLSGRIKGSVGLSALPFSWAQTYAFAGADSFISPQYRYGTDLLLGGEAGLLADAGPWKSHLSATWQRTLFDPVHIRYSLAAEERIAFARNFSLSGNYAWKGDYNKNWNEFGVSLHFFY